MLKIMKPDKDNEPFIVEDERSVFSEEDDDVFIFGGRPLGGGSYDDLDEFDGILPDLDRTLEDCQIALERLKGKRAHALREDTWRSTWPSRPRSLSSAATCRA